MQRKITRDLLTYLPARALPALAAFITVPIYTHLFSPAQYGNYALAAAITDFLILGLATGFGQAVVRFFSAYQLRSNLSSYFAVVYSSVGLIILITTVSCSSFLLAFRSHIPSELYPLLWAALVAFVVTACYDTLADVLRGQEKSRWFTLITVLSTYIGIIFGLVLVLVFKSGIAALLWGQSFGLLLAIIPLVWLTSHKISISSSNLKRSDFKLLWKFALPFTIGNIAYWALNLSDRFFVNLFRGSYEVGLYSVANKVSWRTVQLLVNLFFLTAPPIISRTWEERGRQATEEALTSFTRMYLLIITPAVVGLSVVAAPLVRLLADKAYFDGYPAIGLVAFASMALGLADLGSSGCLVNNRTNLIARNQVIAAFTNLVLNLILISRFGFMGAAWATFLSFFLLAILQGITAARYITWRWPIRSLLRVFLASIAMTATVLMTQSVIRTDNVGWQVASLLVSIVIGALTYCLILWAFSEISPLHILEYLHMTRKPASTSTVVSESSQK